MCIYVSGEWWLILRRQPLIQKTKGLESESATQLLNFLYGIRRSFISVPASLVHSSNHISQNLEKPCSSDKHIWQNSSFLSANVISQNLSIPKVLVRIRQYLSVTTMGLICWQRSTLPAVRHRFHSAGPWAFQLSEAATVLAHTSQPLYKNLTEK